MEFSVVSWRAESVNFLGRMGCMAEPGEKQKLEYLNKRIHENVCVQFHKTSHHLRKAYFDRN